MIVFVAGKPYDLDQLAAELAIVGISTNGLGTDGTIIYTFDGSGSPLALPPEADPVIAAHVPDNLVRSLFALKASGIAGKYVVSLTLQELELLVTALAYKAGALDKATMTILPPTAWYLQ